MIVSGIGCIAPAPSPWRARNKISAIIVCAAPLAAEPSKNTKIPKSKMGFRPTKSESLPKIGTAIAEHNKYAFVTQG